MAIEYSLSCPQGGDGTEGAIVSQNARLTAKIIDWVMQISDPSIPKLFKLTGAVTSIEAIVKAVGEVLASLSRARRQASRSRTRSPRWGSDPARRRPGTRASCSA